MGIHGLTSFIDNNPHLLKDHRLHDCRVVIDGNNFFHFLYFYCKVRFQFGGDYDIYQRKIAVIFSMFKSCNVEPYVVFDGAYTADGKKRRTTVSRARDRIYAAQRIVNGQRGVLIPCLARTTFCQTLNQLGVQHVTCDFEADNQIVTLANQWNCPVISNDSDFYIFDLKGGFIPLDYIDFRLSVSEPREDGNCDIYNFLAVQFYHVDEFIACFKSLNRSLLPLFATMLGNDYVEAAAFEKFYKRQTPKIASRRYSASKKHAKIVSVLYWLEEKGNLEEVLPEVLTFIKQEQRQRVEKLLTSSIQGYVETDDFESFSLKEYFEGNTNVALQNTDAVKSCHGEKLPAWFLKGVRCGEIPVFCLNAVLLQHIILQTQVESVRLPASFLTSTTVRQVVYGILFGSDNQANADKPSEGCPDSDLAQDTYQPSMKTAQNAPSAVEEYTRHNMELRKISVQPCYSVPQYGDLPTLAAVPQLSFADRQAIAANALESSYEFASKFEPSLQLFAMCLAFWVKKSSPLVTSHHLHAVLLSVILLHVRKEIGDREGKLVVGNGKCSQVKNSARTADSESEIDLLQTENIKEGESKGNLQKTADVRAQLDFSSEEDVADNSIVDMSRSVKTKYDSETSSADQDGVLTSETGDCNVEMTDCCNHHDKTKTDGIISLTSVFQSVSFKILQKVRDNLRKFYYEPVKVSSKIPPDHPAFHSTAQLLACLHDAIHLNSLLQCPYTNPQPSLLFNGSFIYSMIQELQNRTNPDLFLLEMLAKGSPLAELLNAWCSTIVSEVGQGFLFEQKVQGTKRCKGTRKKKKMSVAARGGDGETFESALETGQKGEQLVAACDLSNRFGALMLEECGDS